MLGGICSGTVVSESCFLSVTGAEAAPTSGDVDSWRSALETNQQEEVREQLMYIQGIAMNAIPKATLLATSVSELVQDLIASIILPDRVDRPAALLALKSFSSKSDGFLKDTSIGVGSRWFVDRSSHTPVDGDTRLFYDMAFFSFSEAQKDLAMTAQSVSLLQNKLRELAPDDQEVKTFAVVFFRNLGDRQTVASLTKTVNALNQFFVKWISSA